MWVFSKENSCSHGKLTERLFLLVTLHLIFQADIFQNSYLILVSDRIYQRTFLEIDSRHSKITHGKLCSYEQLFWKIQSSQLSQFHHVPLTGLPYWLITIEKVQLINSESNLQSLQHPKSRAVFFSTLGNRKSC